MVQVDVSRGCEALLHQEFSQVHLTLLKQAGLVQQRFETSTLIQGFSHLKTQRCFVASGLQELLVSAKGVT